MELDQKLYQIFDPAQQICGQWCVTECYQKYYNDRPIMQEEIKFEIILLNNKYCIHYLDDTELKWIINIEPDKIVNYITPGGKWVSFPGVYYIKKKKCTHCKRWDFVKYCEYCEKWDVEEYHKFLDFNSRDEAQNFKRKYNTASKRNKDIKEPAKIKQKKSQTKKGAQ
jgi:hypothetical protein